MKMRKLFLSVTALYALAAVILGPAAAADLRIPVVRTAPVVVSPVNWTGFYLGFNLGESKDATSTQENWAWNYLYPANTFVSSGTSSIGGQFSTGFGSTYRRASMGFIGGLQWGYNWQVGALLVGFEGDWNWGNEKDTYTTAGSPVHGTGAFTVPTNAFPVISNSSQGWTSEEKIDWLTTWRARLGWAHDSYLWYITGGVAWAKVENNYTLMSTPGVSGTLFPATGVIGLWGLPGGYAAANFSTTKTGWVLGGGVETSISELFGHNWSLKLEYLYVDLGTVSNTIGTNLVPVNVLCGPGITGCTATGTTSFYSTNHIYEQIIRVGLNYRFSGSI
jgi:outer membrane immunogenic protein